MSWDSAYPAEDKAKQATFRSSGMGRYYAIFRVGKKYKDLNSVKGFQRHMEREQTTPNADKNIANIRIIGTDDIYGDVHKKLEGVKLRKNSVICRELLLTASPDFFRGLPEEQLYKWIDINKKWLEKNFGDNVVYAVLHLDESTPHMHVLICPVFVNSKGEKILSNTRYFDGIAKMRAWQDQYSKAMQEAFKSLNRGVQFSRAKHIDIKRFYGIINNVKSRENAEEIFKNDILLNAKIKALEATLEAHRQLLKDKEKNEQELKSANLELFKQVKDIRKDNDMYRNVIKQLSQTYKLPQNAIEKVMSYVQGGQEKAK